MESVSTVVGAIIAGRGALRTASTGYVRGGFVMALVNEPFVRQKLDEEKAKESGKIFTVRLNDEELKRLQEDARILQQEKPSTTLKILAEIGSAVLHDELTGRVIRTIFKNKANNERLGIIEAEPDFKQL